MLFIVNQLTDCSKKRKVRVEFREICEHRNPEDTAAWMDGYAFMCYSAEDMVRFLNTWLKKIGRTCEKSSFATISDIIDRYNAYIAEGGEPMVIDEAAVQHGKVYGFTDTMFMLSMNRTPGEERLG